MAKATVIAAPAVFRDRHSHCCLRVAEQGEKVHFIQLVEENGAMSVDLHVRHKEEFHEQFHQELRDYPAWRAAAHFCNPLTPAITVTDRALAHLETILQENNMTTTTAAKKTVKKTTAQKNVDATAAASVKTDKTAAGKPVAAVTKDTSKVAGKSPAKGKADAKPGKKAGEGKAPAAKKPSKTERDRASYGDKKIKHLVKSAADAGLREGTIRYKMLEAVLKAKNTDEVLGKEVTVNGEKHAIAGNNLSGMVERGHIELS